MSYDKAKEMARRREIDVAFVYRFDGHECDATHQAHACMDCADSALRVRVVHDDACYSWDDLEGDMFNAEANDDMHPETLASEQADFRASVDRFGVWGVVAEYKDERGHWQVSDSIYGLCDEDAMSLYTAEFKQRLMDDAEETPVSWLAL